MNHDRSRPDPEQPQHETPPEATPAGHRLGTFRFAKTLEFIVLGDDATDPKTVRVLVDDGFQTPYRILTVDGLDRFRPPPESTWLEGWISDGDPWASIIYTSTIGVVRQARNNGESFRRPDPRPRPGPRSGPRSEPNP